MDSSKGEDKDGDGKGKKADSKKKGGHKEDEDPDGEQLAKVFVAVLRTRSCLGAFVAGHASSREHAMHRG